MSDTNGQVDNLSSIVLPTMSGGKKDNVFGKKEKDNKTPNEVWINVGRYVANPNHDPQDPNSSKEVFLGYTLGIPADSAEAPTIPGEDSKNQEYRAIAQGRYSLYKLIEKEMQGMKPGETKKLNLHVEMRRIKPKVDPEKLDTSGNPFVLTSL